MRYEFIEAEKARHSIVLLCQVLQVSRSGYYAWRQRPSSVRARQNWELMLRIGQIAKQARGCYGSPRMVAELRAQGYRVGKQRVARLMRSLGIRARSARRYVVTTQRGPQAAEHLLQREFEAEAPDIKWAGDITYLETTEGWLYLAVLMDLCSRRIVGWSMSTAIDEHLVLGALQAALDRRQPAGGLIHHTDQGRQYLGRRYQRLLEQHNIRCSMSRSGNCWDNAVVESFFATLKKELGKKFTTRKQARNAVFDYIEIFYNRQRRHSALGYQTPHEFEQACSAQTSNQVSTKLW